MRKFKRRFKKRWRLKKIQIQLLFCQVTCVNKVMASFGLRRLYVSSQNWLQPASRFSVNLTRQTSTQWRTIVSQAKYSTMDDEKEPMLPIVPLEKFDSPLPDAVGMDGATDWSKSYFGLSSQPFSKDIAEVLMSPLDPKDVEMKPGEHFRSVSLNFCLLIMEFRWFNLPS